ncbi:MAG: hypothetical protein A3K19_21865 [Lentisphaerae bacterium RIFOXYB12_FULL_65_16]|nr:MAG: hypothetical protein A3K18_04385 [Lentisphaerae bacterium RIFOXYA12_64_32]OGV93905.1 MAG: hypothetical protein A3K19_21865 [Lentisphaerae bacterium RIFOXYB12_FULL_65_16]
MKRGVEEIVPGTPPKSEEEVIEARASFRKQYRFPPENNNLTAAQTRKVRLIYEIDITLSEQIDALSQLAKLNLAIRNILPPETWESVASIPDLSSQQVSLKVLDSLYAVRNNLSRSGELARRETRRTDRNLDLATRSYERAEKQRMDFEDRTGAEDSNSSIVTDRETAALASQAAEEKLALRRLQSRLAQAELALVDNKIERFQPFLADHRLRVIFSPEHVQEQIGAFSAKEADLEKSLLASQEQFDQLTPNAPVSTGLVAAEVTPGETVRQLAQSYGRDAAHARVSLNQSWINHLNIQRQFYGHRVDFYQNKIKRRQMSEITRELDLEIQRLESETDYLRNRMAQARQDAVRIGDQFAGTTGISPQLIQSLQDAAQEIVETLRMEALSTESTLSRLRNFNDELLNRTSGYTWHEIQAILGDRLPLAWNYQLFILNDRAFRVSTLFWVVFLVVIGFFFARYISRTAGSLLTSKAHLAPGVSAAYEKLVLYLLVVVICILIFNLFNFSLTSLTVVSGVLALAVGFGSQEVLKNFISGIILLIERPVHKGDLIEMDGRILKVESIGLRSTQVLDFDNSQKIVPNSLLLENVITNWTLSDNILRSTIPVGVAYGSPTRKTAEVLLEATRSTEGVLASPEPFALFSDFGDSALGFTIYFWTNTADRLKISSEARHRIAEALATENIAISFPQHDVHLDSLNPIRVELSRQS